MRKYGVPTSSAEFLGRTIGSLNLEYYEDLAVQLDDTEDALKSKEPIEAEAEAKLKIQRITLRKQLGLEPKTSQKEEILYDPLIAKWEEQLERGETPDLDEKGA